MIYTLSDVSGVLVRATRNCTPGMAAQLKKFGCTILSMYCLSIVYRFRGGLHGPSCKA